MVFILGASSLHHALETLPTDENSLLKEKTYTIPGLCLKNHAKNPKKIVQNLLLKDCAGKTPDISDTLKTQSILVFRIETDFFSTRKQNDQTILKELKAIHQRPEFELKCLDIILRKEADLTQITAKSRPKRPSKCAGKALKNAASNLCEVLPSPTPRCCDSVQTSLSG